MEKEITEYEGFEFGEMRIEDAGQGMFIVFLRKLTEREEKEAYRFFLRKFSDVQWCPDPESHGEDACAVLNCFYFKEG